MHYLHPRSPQTRNLFTATLAISFAVVALPHLLPCPVDRRQYADTIELPDGTIKRRRRKQPQPQTEDGSTGGGGQEMVKEGGIGRPARECPVPKPGGLLGQIMGFRQENGEKERMAEVVVKPLRARGAVSEKDREEGAETG